VLRPHPLETSDVGWFTRDALPSATVGTSFWGPMAFAAIDGDHGPTHFDPPRSPVWRT
jgi:hypothetical protein